MTGKRYISTQLGGNIKIEADRSASALESMSRFCVHPKWINYLPPTMSPPTSSVLDDFLEHPQEAFSYYKKQGAGEVICEEKHMGSRAVIQIGKSPQAIQAAFGITTGEQGIVYTRSGRRFFNDRTIETAFIEQLAQAIDKAGIWHDLETDWLTLDCEIMPWSMKAMALIKQQYAAVGCTARLATQALHNALQHTQARGIDVSELLSANENSRLNAKQFIQAYQNYCWEVTSLSDVKVAPFHIMASAAGLHTNQDHGWHMSLIDRIVAQDESLLKKTHHQVVNFDDENSIHSAIDWWLKHTAALGEGMVVKPMDFILKENTGIIQPALKVRGKEYLRIIYGMDYTQPHNLQRLKERSVGLKRRLAISEFKLGVESLHRFVNKQPLRYVHECAFAVLAMQSQPVDPRL